jgi:beta-glucanase (GH16 family)
VKTVVQVEGRTRVLVSLAVALCCVVAGVEGGPPDHGGRRWTLVFQDEFDGSSLDLTRWSYHYPWSRTHNHSAYSRSGNVSIVDGKLVLTALEESYGGKPYTTGVVNTSGKFHVTYGYIEARLKMPSTQGSWPAFWMLQDGWPPEIDIMEFPLSDLSPSHNEKYRYWWNYHWGTVSDHRSAGSEEWLSSDLSAGFHDYAVEWWPDSMQFLFDGNVRGTVSDRSAIAESAHMYMILNYAVGGWPGEPTSWPTNGDTYEIDWVRVWKLAEPATFIDLGRVIAGGDGRAGGSVPFVGVHPGTGAFSDDLDLNGVPATGAGPQPVDSAFVDSVFLIETDRSVVNSRGTRFTFPAGDSAGSTWDLIANLVEADSPPGFLRLGPGGPFTRGIGLHSAAGVTFDLDALRARHGGSRIRFFSSWAGEGSLQSGGRVHNHVLLADSTGRLLHAETSGPHRDDGALIEVEIPRNATYLTLAVGSAGDGNGQDHGVFGDAFLTPCSVSDPDLCPPVADEIPVFSGSTWAYLDEGPAPSSDWIGRSFSTAGWKMGRAPLGYGNGDEVTEIGFGGDPDRKRITTYFRRLFAVRDVDEVSGLSLRTLIDDGAIVYLNGTEVLRFNLPTGAVDSGTLAGDTVDGDLEREWLVHALDSCLLVEGTNVLAVEVHQASRTSSDVRLDLVLALDRDPAASPCGPLFLRGDCTGDGAVSGITDAIFLLTYSFLGGEPPPCRAACDADGDGSLAGVGDAVYLLNFSFLGGAPPVAPFPECGPGLLTSDATLGCGQPPASCR